MVHELDKASYYRGALRCLCFVEQQRPTGRRFGPDADARWSSLRGDLETADRLDLLIRDADAQWPGALGARAVFALRAVAEDEPFGPEWQPMDTVDAEELWRAVLAEQAPASVAAALDAMAAAWNLTLAPADPGPIAATDRLLVTGPSAIASAIAAFAAGTDLDWAEQVVCVATPPAHRQLAAAAAALLGTTRPARLAAAHAAADAGADADEDLHLAGYRQLTSDDATEADLALARRLIAG